MFDSNATKPEDFGTNSRNITTSPAETLQTIDRSSPPNPGRGKKAEENEIRLQITLRKNLKDLIKKESKSKKIERYTNLTSVEDSSLYKKVIVFYKKLLNLI